MTAIAVIPARHASQRFPGKPLADRTGKPLIQHVWERTCGARSIRRTIVATDDERIAEAVRAFGGEVEMTRPDHPNGTSRIAEVAERVEARIIVNVQGDEPEVDPSHIERVVDLLLARPECAMSTLATTIASPADFLDANVVKVTLRIDGTALYFSRAPIPHDRDGDAPIARLRHVGLYAYRREFLPAYVAMRETALERTERLEQLRALEHGHLIAVGIVDAASHGIDTPEQYDDFVRRHAAGR